MISLILAWAVSSAHASFFPIEFESQKSAKSLMLDPRMIREAESTMETFRQKAATQLPEDLQLVMTAEWQNNRVNAVAKRSPGIFEIQVYGGLLQVPEIDADALTLILCHELGHLLGGEPLASRNGWSSAEGQADFWSGKFCTHLLQDPEGTALTLARMYASQGGGDYPELTRLDETKVTRTFYGYPKPQCRLDTILAGFKGMNRPGCWYKESK